MEQLVLRYFHDGHNYGVITHYLFHVHGIRRSKRTVQRVLRHFGLRKNGISPGINDPLIRTQIGRAQEETDQRAGYRRTWNILNRRYRLRVTQDVVRRYLRELNPVAVRNRLQGVLQRRRYVSRGPNHVWHCDGYDKLKPYGFALHGAIDGFSRKILWICCATTNNDPKVILNYYLTTVESHGGFPKILRTDCGTETGLAAAAQCTLANSRHSHIYGTSYRNQRIECWWSCLRKCWSQIWMNLFDDLVFYGLFNPSNLAELGVAEFCFLHIIQQELTTFQHDWNNHRIRTTSTSGCPGGIPNELYELPQVYGFENMINPASDHDIQILFSQSQEPPVTTIPEVRNLCFQLCAIHSWRIPVDRDTAISLFVRIINKIR